ncbi:hypothetical protein [Alteromonas ponticola]|uniref:Uncharacterized protein n=1 Tax=Alteromonas ponticola TaxID=2720613 RepID=A0ABX1R3L9_9ALTE|nr:hypothetical protein [Alteromonas ponticola]NMH60256.1 hypothetical protein [Alteromonas ponticola]
MTTLRNLSARYVTISVGITSLSHLLVWIVTAEAPTWLFTFLVVNLVWFLSFREAVALLTALTEHQQKNLPVETKKQTL